MVEVTRQGRKKGWLALATGRVFQGRLFGGDPDGEAALGEVVFNTSLCGYQEILTDPSYQGQIVAMTPSHIGNYGVTPDDAEGNRIFLSGFVVQEESAVFSNWRASMSLHAYLRRAGVPGLSGVDTRALTRHLRSQGAVNGLMSADGSDPAKLVARAKAAPGLEGRDLTKLVTTKDRFEWTEGSGAWTPGLRVGGGENPKSEIRNPKSKHVVVLDFGVKRNILRCLVDEGCAVTVLPADATADQVIDLNPDGVLVSNGPGDPSAVKTGVRTLRGLVEHNLSESKKGNAPFALFGICLGHQLMGLALGGDTYKLKFGHHGANHPIKDLETGRVDITAQNHGFAVAAEETGGRWTVKGNPDAVVTHVNLNDGAVEGLRHQRLPLFSVQYHPEASSGPHDARHLFRRFSALMDR